MLVCYFLSAAKESSKESRAAYENVTFSNGGGHGRPSMGGLKLFSQPQAYVQLQPLKFLLSAGFIAAGMHRLNVNR